jgi:hypothetical protein
MSKRLISDDKLTGIKTFLDYDGDTDDAIISKEQDVSEIIEANKQAYNTAPKKWGDMTHVGRIPLSVYYDLERRGILQDQEALAKWLNDPDNVMWRVRPGTI